MKRKLHRSRRSVFGRRGMHPALKTLLWLVVCVAVVALGYFGAMLLSGDGLPSIDTEVDSNSPAAPEIPGNTNEDGEHADTVDPTPPSDTPSSTEGIRAFYLSPAALTDGSLDATLSAAYKAGFNAVVFDLKDADGTLYYQFTNAQAKKVNAYAPDALTADQLTAALDLMREHGLQPIPRLYAFCDDPAAKVLTNARIGLESNHSWAWYDGDPNNGGKKWLNPYSTAAQDYVLSLAEELKNRGAAAVMLDGVQFPSQLKSAYLGEEAATVNKDDALVAFVSRARAALGGDCPVIVACTSAGALATDTKIYGGNPLTFGPDTVAPQLSSKVKESVEAMLLRMQVLEEKPTLAPMLMMANATVKEANEAMAACIAGGVDSFILVPPQGNDDFSAYTLP